MAGFGKYTRYACLYLILFLLAVLPANICASMHGISIVGNPPTEMYVRIPVQLFYIALLAYVATRKRTD